MLIKIISTIFILALASSYILNTQMSGYFQDTQEEIIYTAKNISSPGNLSIPIVGEIPHTTGIMSFLLWMTLSLDTIRGLFGIIGVFYELLSMLPQIVIVPVIFLGTLGILYGIYRLIRVGD